MPPRSCPLFNPPSLLHFLHIVSTLFCPADVCGSLGLPVIESLPMVPSPVVDWSLEGLESFKAHNAHVSAVHTLVDALQVGLADCCGSYSLVGRGTECAHQRGAHAGGCPWVANAPLFGVAPALRPAAALMHAATCACAAGHTCCPPTLLPLQSDSRLIMHVCLEYSVPHLGLNSELMFGGLGKVSARLAPRDEPLAPRTAWHLWFMTQQYVWPSADARQPAELALAPCCGAWLHAITQAFNLRSSQVVDSFIRHTTRPMLLCAPMYAPFYGPDGSGQPRLCMEPPIATFPTFVSAGALA